MSQFLDGGITSEWKVPWSEVLKLKSRLVKNSLWGLPRCRVNAAEESSGAVCSRSITPIDFSRNDFIMKLFIPTQTEVKKDRKLPSFRAYLWVII